MRAKRRELLVKYFERLGYERSMKLLRKLTHAVVEAQNRSAITEIENQNRQALKSELPQTPTAYAFVNTMPWKNRTELKVELESMMKVN